MCMCILAVCIDLVMCMQQWIFPLVNTYVVTFHTEYHKGFFIPVDFVSVMLSFALMLESLNFF